MVPKISFTAKLVERMFWTAAESAVALGFVHLVDIPVAWMIPAATVLAFVKGQVARHIGDPDDPATIPYGD